MLKNILIIAFMLTLSACGKYIETEPLDIHTDAVAPIGTTAVNVTVVVDNSNTVSQTTTTNEMEPQLPKESSNAGMFSCYVYDFTNRSSLATDLDGAPLLGSFYMKKWDVTPRDWQQGFPYLPSGLSSLKEHFAVRCYGTLKVTECGMHTFQLTSDDGMRLLLNSVVAVSDDSLHSPRSKSATVHLSKGKYHMEVQWFQGPRTEIAAELKYSSPSNSTLQYVTSTGGLCHY